MRNIQLNRLATTLAVALFAVVLTGCNKEKAKQPTDSYDPMAVTLEKLAKKGQQNKKQGSNTKTTTKTTE